MTLPPMSIDNTHQHPHFNDSALDPLDSSELLYDTSDSTDEHPYSKIQSYLENSARESHSSFHRTSSLKDELDEESEDGGESEVGEVGEANSGENKDQSFDQMLDTGDMSCTLTTVNESSSINPFATNGDCEELTSTGIQKRLQE